MQHCWKHLQSQSYRSVRPSYLRQRDRGNYKESAACVIIEASNSSHFHIPLIFCSLLSQPCSIRYVFSILFLILEIQKNSFSAESLHHKDSNMFRRFNKVNPCSVEVSTWMGDQIRIPWVAAIAFSFYSFFPFLFQSIKDCRTAILV